MCSMLATKCIIPIPCDQDSVGIFCHLVEYRLHICPLRLWFECFLIGNLSFVEISHSIQTQSINTICIEGPTSYTSMQQQDNRILNIFPL